MSQSRQLAAIMFTDIVGYTALMGKDEQKAFELLKKNREIQKPIIEQYNGRWIKELGDGVMASFNTVSDAVNAAIKIQEGCNAANEFKLRIGIHLGEVVFENDDVFGDGVNIASRIQAMANPGSIFISEAVNHSISNKTEFHTKFFKTEKLKNVKEQVKIYQVIAEGVIQSHLNIGQKVKPKSKTIFFIFSIIALLVVGYLIYHFLITAKVTGQSAKTNDIIDKSIAVLPFVDMSPDKSQGYLGDGLAEEIINSISAINHLRVIGSTSSFQFKGNGMDALAIGKKLNVGTVLEGTIQKSGNNIRITTRLISVKDSSKIIWSEKFDSELKDIFAIQDSIASNIVQKLKITLSEMEKPRLIKKETNHEVYTQYLKGLYIYKQDSLAKSIEYNLQAIAIDSTYAPSYAYIALAKTWLIKHTHTFDDFTAIREAKDFANKAIKLDPTIAE